MTPASACRHRRGWLPAVMLPSVGGQYLVELVRILGSDVGERDVRERRCELDVKHWSQRFCFYFFAGLSRAPLSSS